MEIKGWLMFALIAMVLLSIANVLMKSLLNGFGKDAIDLGILSSLNSAQLLLLLGIIIFTAIGAISFIGAINEGKPALVTAVVSLSTVMVALLSVVFLQEQFTTKEIIGMVLATISILILAV